VLIITGKLPAICIPLIGHTSHASHDLTWLKLSSLAIAVLCIRIIGQPDRAGNKFLNSVLTIASPVFIGRHPKGTVQPRTLTSGPLSTVVNAPN